jgi:hypothetical protein
LLTDAKKTDRKMETIRNTTRNNTKIQTENFFKAGREPEPKIHGLTWTYRSDSTDV